MYALSPSWVEGNHQHLLTAQLKLVKLVHSATNTINSFTVRYIESIVSYLFYLD